MSWPLVGVATAVVMVTVWSGMFEVGPRYFEAPGLAILTLVNRDFHWDVNAFHWLLGAAALVSIVLLALRHRRGVRRSGCRADGSLAHDRPDLRDDRKYDDGEQRSRRRSLRRGTGSTSCTGGAHVTFLGQSVTDGNPLWLTEFWNRSLSHVASLNGVAPGPGPISAPGLKTTGRCALGLHGRPVHAGRKRGAARSADRRACGHGFIALPDAGAVGTC